MGDGGPEPYRLWWTLLQVGGVKARVLDGGLAAWKHIGEALAAGEGTRVTEGDAKLAGGVGDNLMIESLTVLQGQHADLQYIDTRSIDEFTGKMQHKKSTRAGHIPKAKHLAWTETLKLTALETHPEGVPVLKSGDEIKAMIAKTGILWDKPVITYCQSGTRSAAVYYAMIQAGYEADMIWNYDGSWAEYSRSDKEIETGEL
jgi:thiosulfate/3-mercaptopyruvate sulfurtransferase